MADFKKQHTQFIKAKAQELGFDFCGISKAEFLEEEAPRLEQWLKQSMHGNMHYMENHFDKRLDPRLLVEGAKSVVSLLYNYSPQMVIASENNYKISKYAYGEDYHDVIRQKLKAFLASIQTQIGEVNGRVFVDSAPVLDKAWAARSGLGWQGKNSNLIHPRKGSFFFIAEMILDLDLVYDSPIRDYCGTCTRCLDACPTEAIVAPFVVDGSKCISYFTIELKEEIPERFAGQFEDWIFGCDICQDVCPWNRFAQAHQEPNFEPSDLLQNMRKKDWEELTEDVFGKIFKKSAVKRTKFKGLKRNITFVSKPKAKK
ncbi:MAG: tRNA epoxyqueuosine(34) reductase QueG [Microscillaceae bacterium]|nr:tRNA epoxyqueuosine(34) reductase QueG [Microscillaceae bacterium]